MQETLHNLAFAAYYSVNRLLVVVLFTKPERIFSGDQATKKEINFLFVLLAGSSPLLALN